jgi:hypothetical protein
MGKSNVGDVNYFPTVLKMKFDTGIARSLGHRAKPLRFFTVYCNTVVSVYSSIKKVYPKPKLNLSVLSVYMYIAGFQNVLLVTMKLFTVTKKPVRNLLQEH